MPKPNIFSKTSIFIFSAVGSTFFGALLYSSNLQEVNKRKFILPTIAFSLVWNIAFHILLRDFNFPIFSFLIINALGGLILIKPFWNYHFHDLEEYNTRKIWGPAIALVVPISILLGFHYFNPPTSASANNQNTDFISLRDSAESNAIFIQNDTIVNFEGLTLTLPSYSYYHTINTEYLDALNSTIYFEEGNFTFKLMIDKKNRKEVLNLDFLKSKVDSISLFDKPFLALGKTTVGYYDNYEADTLAASGQFLLFQKNTVAYLAVTDYPLLSVEYGDSLSDFLFNSMGFHN